MYGAALLELAPEKTEASRLWLKLTNWLVVEMSWSDYESDTCSRI